MRDYRCLIFIVGVAAASSCQADIDVEAMVQRIRDSLAVHRQARYGLLPGTARGDAETALVLDSAEYTLVYADLLPRPALGAVDRDPPVDSRPMLDVRFLAHDAAHGHPDPMPAAVRAGLLATGLFRAACGTDTLPACTEGAGVSYAVSRVYGIAPGVARVFVARTDSASVEERVYRVEQRARYWEVTDQEMVRYRGPMYPL